MASSYNDLQIYRTCPRLFGFTKLGYRPVAKPEPMLTGALVHEALSSYFRGSLWPKALADATNEAAANLNKIQDYQGRAKALEELERATIRAEALVKRYIASWAKDYKATLIEPELNLQGVVCHPNLIATYRATGQKVVVDFLASYHPDERWYDVSGQCDLYAYVLSRTVGILPNGVWPEWSPFREGIDLIVYDVISEEGLYRHMRPPRLEAGKRLFHAVQELNKLITKVKMEDEHKIRHYGSVEKLQAMCLLDDPHPNYTCPSQCLYFQACWLLETGSWGDCRDFLESNFLWEGK